MVEENKMGDTGRGGDGSKSQYGGGRLEANADMEMVLDRDRSSVSVEDVGEEKVPHGEAAMRKNSPDGGIAEEPQGNAVTGKVSAWQNQVKTFPRQLLKESTGEFLEEKLTEDVFLEEDRRKLTVMKRIKDVSSEVEGREDKSDMKDQGNVPVREFPKEVSAGEDLAQERDSVAAKGTCRGVGTGVSASEKESSVKERKGTGMEGEEEEEEDKGIGEDVGGEEWKEEEDKEEEREDHCKEGKGRSTPITKITKGRVRVSEAEAQCRAGAGGKEAHVHGAVGPGENPASGMKESKGEQTGGASEEGDRRGTVNRAEGDVQKEMEDIGRTPAGAVTNAHYEGIKNDSEGRWSKDQGYLEACRRGEEKGGEGGGKAEVLSVVANRGREGRRKGEEVLLAETKPWGEEIKGEFERGVGGLVVEVSHGGGATAGDDKPHEEHMTDQKGGTEHEEQERLLTIPEPDSALNKLVDERRIKNSCRSNLNDNRQLVLPSGSEKDRSGTPGQEGERGTISNVYTLESSYYKGRVTSGKDEEQMRFEDLHHRDSESNSLPLSGGLRSFQNCSHEDFPLCYCLAERARNGDGSRGGDARASRGEFDRDWERNPFDFECFHSDFPFCGCVSHQNTIYDAETKGHSTKCYGTAGRKKNTPLKGFEGEPRGGWNEERPLEPFENAPEARPRRKVGCDMSNTLGALKEPWLDVSDETEEREYIESSTTKVTEDKPNNYDDSEHGRRPSCAIRISGAFEEEAGGGVRGETIGALPPDGAAAELDSVEGATGYSVPDTTHSGADMFPSSSSASSLLAVPPAVGQAGAVSGPTSRRASIVTCDSRRASVIVQPEPIRIAVFGKDGVGKSALIVRLLTRRFIGEYDPTMEAVYSYHLPPEAHQPTFDALQPSQEPPQLPMQIMDTAGTMDVAEDGRESQVSWGEGFMLVFSLTSKASLHDLHHIRRVILELTPGAPRPMVLVGNKADLSHQREIQDEEIRDLSSCWGCDYFEVAAPEPWEIVVRPFTAIYQAVLDARGTT